MKRAITLVLAVALVGGLLFAGFAGTAAAQEGGNISVDVDAGDGGDADGGEATVDQSNDQSNSISQVGIAEADSETSKAGVEQESAAAQTNENSQVGVASADAEAGDGGDAEADVETGLSGDDVDSLVDSILGNLDLPT